MEGTFKTRTPEDTYDLAFDLGGTLRAGDVVLFRGSLGAGKTLFTKGIAEALGFDPDEVTSPSFALVNLYKGEFDLYHLDLWRIESDGDIAFDVGLDEILENENAVVIVEWSEKLNGFDFGRSVTVVEIEGSGLSERKIVIERTKPPKTV